MLLSCAAVAVLALVAVSGVRGDPAQEPQILRWKFDRGQQLRVHIVRSNKTTTTSEGRPATERQEEMSFDWLIVVNDVDNVGAAQMTISTERAAAKFTTPEGKFEFDTSAENPTTQAADVNMLRTVMTAVRFKASINPRGEILDAKYDEQSIKALKDDAAVGLLERFSSAASVKDMLRNLFGEFPSQRA